MISIIIPTYQESATISEHIKGLKERLYGTAEIIVVDATSCEITRNVCREQDVLFISTEKGRARQMNAGARYAKGQILYFLHADSVPPFNFDKAINEAVANNRKAGCFYMGFDEDHPVLKLSGWFTRFKSDWCRGGDQSLFITKNLFGEIGGFDESCVIMEDSEIIPRIKKRTDFEVIQQKLVTSARRYRENGVLRLQLIFGVIHIGYRLGFSQQTLLKFYNKHIG